MLRYIIKRIIMIIPVMLAVTLVIFTLLHFTPGDPAAMMLGEQATQEAIAQKREELGLNDPFFVQYFNYVLGLAQGDMGVSYTTGRDVSTELFSRFPVTIKLATFSIIIAVLIGVPIGIISATKQYSLFDNVSMIVALIGVSIPNFWQGMMLMLLFAVHLQWVPATGIDEWTGWILPSITVGTSTAAIITRMTRSSMLEVRSQDYVRTARAKGQKESKIILKHQLNNALIPIITVIGLQFGSLLGGAVLTESVFAIPGLGKLMVDSIKEKNYPVVQGGVLLIALTFVVVNLIVDILYAYVDPRIKANYSHAKKGGH